jgi:GAF domain-containing protein
MGRSGDPRKRVGARQFVGLGMVQEVTPARQQSADATLDAELAQAAAAGRHYWQAIAQYRLSEESARDVVGLGGGTPHLDSENLRGVMVGCFICEQPVSPALIDARCPGDPSGMLR